MSCPYKNTLPDIHHSAELWGYRSRFGVRISTAHDVLVGANLWRVWKKSTVAGECTVSTSLPLSLQWRGEQTFCQWLQTYADFSRRGTIKAKRSFALPRQTILLVAVPRTFKTCPLFSHCMERGANRARQQANETFLYALMCLPSGRTRGFAATKCLQPVLARLKILMR